MCVCVWCDALWRNAMRCDEMWCDDMWFIIVLVFYSFEKRAHTHTHISYIGVDEFIFHYLGPTFSTLFAYCRWFCAEWIYDLLWRVLNQNPTTHFNIVSLFLFFKKYSLYCFSSCFTFKHVFRHILYTIVLNRCFKNIFFIQQLF